MSKIRDMKPFRTADGTEWGVDAELPTTSAALIIFHHPDGRTSRKDRYAWYQWNGPESRNVKGRIDVAKVRAALDEKAMQELFKRSMLIGSGRPGFATA